MILNNFLKEKINKVSKKKQMTTEDKNLIHHDSKIMQFNNYLNLISARLILNNL